MTKEIPLTKGYVAIVDDEDFEELSRYRWCVHVLSHTCYAMRREPGTRRTVLMHREIVACGAGFEVDHINHSGLDNRRTNLRAVTRSANNMNRRKQSGTSSSFRGVAWDATRSKWKAYITVDGALKNIGRFDTEIAAAKAYNEVAAAVRGGLAVLNAV